MDTDTDKETDIDIDMDTDMDTNMDTNTDIDLEIDTDMDMDADMVTDIRHGHDIGIQYHTVKANCEIRIPKPILSLCPCTSAPRSQFIRHSGSTPNSDTVVVGSPAKHQHHRAAVW